MISNGFHIIFYFYSCEHNNVCHIRNNLYKHMVFITFALGPTILSFQNHKIYSVLKPYLGLKLELILRVKIYSNVLLNYINITLKHWNNCFQLRLPVDCLQFKPWTVLCILYMISCVDLTVISVGSCGI